MLLKSLKVDAAFENESRVYVIESRDDGEQKCHVRQIANRK